MAQQDITGLLTGIFTGDPVAQQQQLLSQQAVAQNPNLLASTQTQIGRAPAQLSRMRQNVGGMFGQDLRSAGQKVQEQLKGLDVTKPEGQQQAVSLISQIDPARAQALQIEFNEKNKAEAQFGLEKEQTQLRASSMAQALNEAGYDSLAQQVNLGDREAYKKGLELISPEKGKTTIQDIVDPTTGITNKVQVDSSGTILRTVGISKMPTIKTITLPNGDIVLENTVTGKRGEPQPTEESANQEKQRIEKLYSDLTAVDNVLLTVSEAKTLAEDFTGSGILYNLSSLGVGTSARELAGKISTLQSTLAFDRLQKMRDESKTGGALGQVSNIELQLLQNSLTALDPIIGEEAFKNQLEKVEKHYNNFRKALLGQPIDIDWTQPAYKGKTTVVDGVRYMIDPADSSKVFAIGKE